jgi:carbonic anhydrase
MPFEKLVKGFRQFQSEYFKKDKRLYARLIKHGQNPEALVIACSDSRNDPALLMNSEPGDIFVVRNVAAIVPPYGPDGNYHGTSAAIEFAVKGLKVRDIIVLGHASCGGVRELASGTACARKFEFLSNWIEIGATARDAVEEGLADASPEVRLRALEQAIILTSLNNLMTFPWIKEAVEAGEMRLHGWYFDMLNGKMLNYDFSEGYFIDTPPETPHVFSVQALTACNGHFPLDPLLRSHA